MKTKKYIRAVLIVLIWLTIWQVLALIVDNDVLLAGPYETAKALVSLSLSSSFYISVGITIGKVLIGYLIGFALGSILAVMSYKWKGVKEFFSPFVTVIKSIPIVSFIIIALIWAGSTNASIIVSAIITFPIFYKNILEGLFATDRKMIDLAKVYQMKTSRKVRYIYLPSLAPQIRSAVSLAVGMAFRGGITAEVVGQPLRSIGNGLYRAKVNLATAEMLAWTLVAVLAAFAIERLFAMIVKKVLK